MNDRFVITRDVKRGKRPWTAEELEAIWRDIASGPDFIGPVGPPMELWLRSQEAQRQWRTEVNLAASAANEEKSATR